VDERAADTVTVALGESEPEMEPLLVELGDRDCDIVGETVLETAAEAEIVCGVTDRSVLPDREGELDTEYDGLLEGDAEFDRDTLLHAVGEFEASVDRDNDGVTLDVATARLETETLRDIVTVGVVDDEIDAENDGEFDLNAEFDSVTRHGDPETVEHTVAVGDRDAEMVADAECDVDRVGVVNGDVVDVIEFVVDSVLVTDIVGDTLMDGDSVAELESVEL
jgi:hypothetical protein